MKQPTPEEAEALHLTLDKLARKSFLLGVKKAEETNRANRENAWSTLRMIRLAIETTCPAGVLPSEDAVLGLYGPEPIHEGEALAKAIIETVERLTK
jgi:hypothetical protein